MTKVGPRSIRIDDKAQADRMAILVANKVGSPCVILYPQNVDGRRPLTMNLESAQQLRADLDAALEYLAQEEG